MDTEKFFIGELCKCHGDGETQYEILQIDGDFAFLSGLGGAKNIKGLIKIDRTTKDLIEQYNVLRKGIKERITKLVINSKTKSIDIPVTISVDTEANDYGEFPYIYTNLTLHQDDEVYAHYSHETDETDNGYYGLGSLDLDTLVYILESITNE